MYFNQNLIVLKYAPDYILLDMKMPFFYLQNNIEGIKKALKIKEYSRGLCDPKGIRTPITAVKGRGPNH